MNIGQRIDAYFIAEKHDGAELRALLRVLQNGQRDSDVKMTGTAHDRFTKIIGELAYPTSSDLFIYAGGCDHPKDLAYFVLKFPDQALPEPCDRCICGTRIKRQRFIFHRETHELRTVGSCCINRFLPTGLKRTCSRCGRVHKNRLDDFCSDCRKLLKCEKHGKTCVRCGKGHRNRLDNLCNGCRGGIMHVGKYDTYSFSHIYDHDPEYCAWVLRTPMHTKNMRKFTDYIIRRNEEPEDPEEEP